MNHAFLTKAGIEYFQYFSGKHAPPDLLLNKDNFLTQQKQRHNGETDKGSN
jgi:hypothetical protein